MTKEDIIESIKQSSATLEQYDLHISPSGKNITYKNFDIKFVMSKYGYEDRYGLSFFLRAENKNAEKDKYGNIDSFAKGNEYNLTPASLSKHQGKQQLRAIYNKNVQLLAMDNYFCALDKAMLDGLISYIIPYFVQYLDTKVGS